MMIQGSILRARLDWVRETASRDETIEFFESLPAEVRRDATRANAAASYPATTLVEIDRVIAGLFGEQCLRELPETWAGA